MGKRNIIFALAFIVILSTSQAATASNTEIAQPSSLQFFEPFYERFIDDDGAITRDLFGSTSDIATSRGSGLTLVTLMKLYDLYNQDVFLEHAKDVSDYLTTSLQDPRYPLFATYYDTESAITSNIRSSVDNLLIAWGLDQLSDRIDPEQELEVKIQDERVSFIEDDLDLFLNGVGLPTSLRVDIEETVSSQVFDVYSNLLNAFILTESNSEIFDLFADKPEEIFSYVKENATSTNGGVHTIVSQGYTDNIITLTNTALFANLALNLHEQTGETMYREVANSTMEYIQDTFYDIGVTGGYFETVVDDSPVQQSKSLFSHALLLNLLMGLANLGDQEAKLNLLALWRTITEYFRKSDHFVSTINRGGKSASLVINTEDNLMMTYAMSSLPLFSELNYTSDVEFRNKIALDLTLQVPENINSRLILKQAGQKIRTIDIEGQDSLQQIEIELDPTRPDDDIEIFQYSMELISEGVQTDSLSFEIRVQLSSGVSLTPGVVTVFSIIAIVIFALFVNNYVQEDPEEEKV